MSVFGKILYLLSPRQRRASLLLCVLTMVGMVLETIGVGVVVPALAVMTQKDITTKYPAIAPLLNAIGNPDTAMLVVWGMGVLVLIYAFKTAFMVLLTWRQIDFAYAVQADLSQRLFAGYLRQPYAFHLQRNSAQLIRNAIGETEVFTKMALTAGITLATEILVVVGIGLLLLSVEPLGATVVMAVLALTGWGFHRGTHRRILSWGKARQFHDGMRLQHLQQGLGGVKDVLVLGRAAAFREKFRQHALGSARAASMQSILQQMPRLALEFLAVAGIAALVLIMVGQAKPIETVLPTLGLFAAAAFRLMPSATRVMSSAQNVRYSIPVIHVLYEELHSVSQQREASGARLIDFSQSIAIEAMSFRYSSADNWALREISASIRKGESLGIVGGSGSGKSTLVDVILGLLVPTEGKVRVDGVDIRDDMRNWQNSIGYVPQSVFLIDDTLRRNVAFGLEDAEIDEARVWRALRSAQLQAFVETLPEGLNTMVGERGVRLSGGQLQRIGIARALYHDPAVLVLDEATSALDTDVERGVMDAVRALQGAKTVLIVAHRLSTVEHCDRVIRLESGRVLQEGEPAQVLGTLASHG